MAHFYSPIECTKPYSMFALSRFDMARIVRLRNAINCVTMLVEMSPEFTEFSSSVIELSELLDDASVHSLRSFINSVKYLNEEVNINYGHHCDI